MNSSLTVFDISLNLEEWVLPTADVAFMCWQSDPTMGSFLCIIMYLFILLLLYRLKRSPLALVLVVVILLLYLVLIGFCIRADKHDNKKAQAVYITENTSGSNPKAPAITERWFTLFKSSAWLPLFPKNGKNTIKVTINQKEQGCLRMEKIRAYWKSQSSKA